MIKTAFGNDSLNRSKTLDWFNHLKDGRYSTEDDSHSESPSTNRNNDVTKICKKKYELA